MTGYAWEAFGDLRQRRNSMHCELDGVFEVYIEDDRYSVPTLRFVVADSSTRAWEMALQLLNENQHHIGVEIRVGDRSLGGLGTYTTSSGCGPPRIRAGGS
jgi:hypothetical protein